MKRAALVAFAVAGDPALRPEADNGRLILAGRAGRIEPLRCLEALLLAVQAERYPMLTQPSEFGAFILRRPAGARRGPAQPCRASRQRSRAGRARQVTRRACHKAQRAWLRGPGAPSPRRRKCLRRRCAHAIGMALLTHGDPDVPRPR